MLPENVTVYIVYIVYIVYWLKSSFQMYTVFDDPTQMTVWENTVFLVRSCRLITLVGLT